MSSFSGTVSMGLNLGAGFGPAASISVGITYDAKGNIGLIATGAGGGGTPSASANLF